jgi:hypothetical protein
MTLLLYVMVALCGKLGFARRKIFNLTFIMIACPNILGTKFRYVPASFGYNDSGTAIQIPPLLAFIFR